MQNSIPETNDQYNFEGEIRRIMGEKVWAEKESKIRLAFKIIIFTITFILSLILSFTDATPNNIIPWYVLAIIYIIMGQISSRLGEHFMRKRYSHLKLDKTFGAFGMAVSVFGIIFTYIFIEPFIAVIGMFF